MAGLCDFYSEVVTRVVCDCGLEYDAYYTAHVRMFEQGLTRAAALQAVDREKMPMRFDAVRGSLHAVGWGIFEVVNEIWHDRVDLGTVVFAVRARV